jgi:hypothetical protein
LTEVRRWLEGRGLERHADLFEKGSIDFARLLSLSEVDLIQLGLAPDSRRAILREIAIASPGGSPLSDVPSGGS